MRLAQLLVAQVLVGCKEKLDKLNDSLKDFEGRVPSTFV